MKAQIKLLAAGVAMATAGVATAGALNADVEVIVGGATAPQEFLREDIMLRICDKAQTIQVFVDTTGSDLDEVQAGNEILNHGDHQVVFCTADASVGGNLAGKTIAVYKYNGGSATGVAPVVDPAGAPAGNKEYMDASTSVCAQQSGNGSTAFPIGTTGASFELYTCDDDDIVVQNPDAGISDVEPSLFTGSLALNAGDEPLGVSAKPTVPFVDQGNLVLAPGPGLMFGVGVTLPMYNELVDDQASAGMLPASCNGAAQSVKDSIACMPSLPSTVVKAVFTGSVTSWADVDPYGLDLNPTVARGDAISICKRTNGSGTHAQFSVNFLGTNCRAVSNFSMAEVNDGLAAPGLQVGVYANSGSSDMDKCLNALGTGLGFDGDFDDPNDSSITTLPPTTFAGNGDSSVVPGTSLPAGIPAEVRFGGNVVNPGYDYDANFQSYAMGYQALEKNTGLGLAWRFVKVDGVAPTLENAVNGTYRDIYYLSFQWRKDGSGNPDIQSGGIRDVADVTPAKAALVKEYLDIWNNIDPAAIAGVNATLVVDPNGISGDSDDWQGGYVTTVAGAAQAYDGVSPATPWERVAPNGAPDSCQDQTIAN